MASMVPVLKWVGGKRWLLSQNYSIFPQAYTRLIEPFAGGAAVFFGLCPESGWLNDLNADLMNTYEALAEDWEGVFFELESHQKKHNANHYYEVRRSKPRLKKNQAARFIYLNRTCFNGLYRVNLNGEFNVPIGTKTAVLMPSDDFAAVSALLKTAKLTTLDFEDVVDQAIPSDFLFVDPPYTVRHNLNGFIKYNEKLFSWSDQVRLRDALFRASRRGVEVVMSNADHECIRELYSGCQEIKIATRRSVMAAAAENRKTTTELLIRV